MPWAAKMYRFWAGRRLLLAALVICGLAGAGWLAGGLSPDTSLKPLLPDSSDRMRRGVDLLELAPFSKFMFVQLTAETEAAALRLPRAADDFLAGLAPELAVPLEPEWPDLKKIMAFLPALSGPRGLDRAREAADGAQMAERLEELKKNLSLLGGPHDLFWRLDPLNLRGEVFGKFPAHQGRLGADPLGGHQISPDGRHLLLTLTPKVSMNDPEGSQALTAELDRLTRELPPGLSAQTVGAQRHTAANSRAVMDDLRLTMSLAFLLILAIYLFLVRSWGAFWLFLTPAVAVLAAAAVLRAAFPVVSGLALGFGAAVLGIAEDYAVHVHYALRRAESPAGALERLARPLMMSALLCVAGFGVLLFSSVPAIRQLAFFSAVAVAVGYLWAMIVLPHCPAVDRPREVSGAGPGLAAARGRVKGLWPVLAGLTGLSAFLISQAPMQISIRALGLESPEILRDQALVEEVWRLEGGRRLYLLPGENLEEALDLAGRLTRALSPASASSLAALLPPAAEQEAHLAAWRKFAAEGGPKIAAELDEAARRAGFAPGAFDPFLEWFLAPPRTVTPDALIEAGLGPLVENFLPGSPERPLAVVVAESSAPEPPAEFAGRIISLSPAELERDLSRALAGEKRLLPYCVVVCLGLLIWTFRDIGQALLAFIPALAALAAVLGLQLALGRPLGLAEAAALPLIICLGADYGIVVVSELIDHAELGAGRAIFVSGLSTIAGIGILILARHPVMHALGRTVFIGLAVAMPVSILLLPKMYSRVEEAA